MLEPCVKRLGEILQVFVLFDSRLQQVIGVLVDHRRLEVGGRVLLLKLLLELFWHVLGDRLLLIQQKLVVEASVLGPDLRMRYKVRELLGGLDR